MCSFGSQSTGTVWAVIYILNQRNVNFNNYKEANTNRISLKACILRGLFVIRAILLIPKWHNIALGATYVRESIGSLCTN